jgi:hypothetical protein
MSGSPEHRWLGRGWGLPGEQSPRRGSRLHPAFREPARLALVAAGGVMALGSLLDWIEAWLPYRGTFSVSGFEQAGDGAITLVLSLLMVAFAWSEQASESRTPVVVAAPLALGVVGLLVLRDGYQEATFFLEDLATRGGHGFVLPGFWIALAGAAATTLVGAIRIWRLRDVVRFSFAVRWRTVLAAIGAVVGAVAGYLAGVGLTSRLLEGAMGGTLASVLILAAILGTILGAWVGARVVGALAASYGD